MLVFKKNVFCFSSQFICVVILALAVSTQAGILPVLDVATSWGTHAWGPALVNHWGSPISSHVSPWGAVASPWGVPSVLAAHGALVGPTLAAHGHGPVVHGPVVHGPVVGVHGH